jgi:hypothetical protein
MSIYEAVMIGAAIGTGVVYGVLACIFAGVILVTNWLLHREGF